MCNFASVDDQFNGGWREHVEKEVKAQGRRKQFRSGPAQYSAYNIKEAAQRLFVSRIAQNFFLLLSIQQSGNSSQHEAMQ